MTRHFCALTLATLALAAGDPAHASPSSVWTVYESIAVLADVCPSAYREFAGSVTPEDFKEPTRIIRERETAFTTTVMHGNRAAAERAMEAYKANIARQVRDGVERQTCDGVLIALGYKRPGAPMKPWTYAEMVDRARTVPLPSTARPADLPASMQIGTQADPDLQRLLLRIFANPDERACDPKTAKVTLMNRKPIEAENIPPYVGTPERITEAWTLTCKDAVKTYTVTYTQDARTWKRYEIE